MNYLLKTEPTVYSFANLQRDKTTIWDGVTNPAAVKRLIQLVRGAVGVSTVKWGAPVISQARVSAVSQPARPRS